MTLGYMVIVSQLTENLYLMAFRFLIALVTLNIGSNQTDAVRMRRKLMSCDALRRSHQIPDSPIRVVTIFVSPVPVIKFLVVHVDSHLSLRTNI